MTLIDPALAAKEVLHFDTLEEWLAARRQYIGASDTAGIFGVGYGGQDPTTVWESKVCDVPVEITEEDEKRFKIGHILEPAIRELFTLETGLTVEPPNGFEMRISKEHPFMAATLDGEAIHPEYGKAPVELKNVGNWALGEWSDGRTPIKFQIQGQHQLAVTGDSYVAIVGWLAGQHKIEVRWLKRDDRFIAAMLARLEEFWECVEANRMPTGIDPFAVAAVLKRLHPDDNGECVRLPVEAESWGRAVTEMTAHIKMCEKIREVAKNKLRAVIGGNTFAVCGDRTWSNKTQTKPACETKAATFRVLRSLKRRPKEVIPPPPLIEREPDKVKRLPSHIVQDIRRRIFERDDRCIWCKKQLTPETATLEHIIPLSRGGDEREENHALACAGCNQGRGDLL